MLLVDSNKGTSVSSQMDPQINGESEIVLDTYLETSQTNYLHQVLRQFVTKLVYFYGCCVDENRIPSTSAHFPPFARPARK